LSTSCSWVIDLGLLGEQTHRALATRCTEVKRMLTALIQKLTAES
jgi:hypothetical protein